MHINRQGITRIVFVFHFFVVKIPNIFNYLHCIKGLLANIQETNTYRWNSGKYYTWKCSLLCPVFWASWGGWIIVMKRARVLTKEEFESADTRLHREHFYGDDKFNNYGYIDNRVVKIDYGQS